MPELYCQRKFGLRALERFEDAFRGSKERVNLESTAMGDKYEIFAGKGQDAVWLRRLFAPTFIVWLTESAPKKFAFELVGGTLCCYVSGHKKKAEELDEIGAATAAVAKRLRDEALEDAPARTPPSRVPALAIRPAAIISRTEGTRTRATTSWIFGAARAARSSTARRLSRRRAPAWRRSCSASGEPKRRERSIAATRVASSLPGTRARSERRAAPSGTPQESSATVSRSSSASGPSPARASCSSPAAGPRPEPALTASRSSASGSAASRRRWRRARLALQQRVGDEEAGRRQPDRDQQRGPPRRRRCRGQGGEAAAGGPGELRRQHRGQRQPRLQAGAPQPLGQPQPQRRPGRAPAQAEGQRRQAAPRPAGQQLAGGGEAEQDRERRQQPGGAHSTTREKRLIATKPTSWKSGGEAQQHRRRRRAEQLGDEAGLDQLGEEGAAARHRHHQQAGEAGLGGGRARVLGDPVALGGAGGEAAQQPGQVAAGQALAEQGGGEGVDPLRAHPPPPGLDRRGRGGAEVELGAEPGQLRRRRPVERGRRRPAARRAASGRR